MKINQSVNMPYNNASDQILLVSQQTIIMALMGESWHGSKRLI